MSPVINPSGGGGGGITKLSAAQISRAVAVGGDITLNNTAAFAEVAAATGGPGTGGLDLTIAAATSDVLLVSGVLILANTAASSMTFDTATWVSGAGVNWIGQAGPGAATIGVGFVASGVVGVVSFAAQYVVQAGDITGGNVVLRLHYRNGSATNRVVGRSTANGPLTLGVANLLH